MPESNRAPAIVVMGVSGSGKSTVAAALARHLGWDFVDADDLHPAANIAAMSTGRPLTDADRAPWLAAVAARMRELRSAGRSCVVACSALRRRYRDVLRDDGVVFVHLVVDPARVAERVAARTDHFVPVGLVGSQFETLEPLDADEAGIEVDATAPVGVVVTAFRRALTERFPHPAS